MNQHPQDARPSDYRRAVESEAARILGERRGEPLEIERLLPADQRRTSDNETTRSRCIRRIVAHVGHGGMRAFLRERQPALGDRTGAELLQNDPEELMRRLESLDDHDDEIDLALADVRPAQRRSEREVSRVLRILDALDGKESAR